MISRVLHRISKFRAVKFSNVWLPKSRSLNFNLENNDDYINSALIQIEHLYTFLDKEREYRFLDFGCGQGRVANGLIYGKYNISQYFGIDTENDFILWCKKWISKYNPKYNFIHIDSNNQRYNIKAKEVLPLPNNSNSIDVVFLNSVFSHMLTKDVLFYLKEFSRVLVSGGIVYLTAFIEEDVPDVEENPDDYIDQSIGPLHRVRYAKNYFMKLIEESELVNLAFFHQYSDRTKQSVFILKNK